MDQLIVCLDGTPDKATSSEQKPDADKQKGEKKTQRLERKDPVTPKVTRSGKIFDWRRYSTAQAKEGIGYSDFQNILIDELAIADNNSLYASDQSTLELRLSTDSESLPPTDLVFFGIGAENATNVFTDLSSASLTPSTTLPIGQSMCNTDPNTLETIEPEQTQPEFESMQHEVKSSQPEVEKTRLSEESETQCEHVQNKQTGRKYRRKQRRARIPVVIELHPSLLVSPPKYSCLKELFKENGTENHSEKTVRWIDDKENAPLCQIQTFEQPGLRKCTLKKKLYTD
uniref:Uncharacterized protein n=1 Tax=Ditylenchus dipsaci TaxID=166011 RepID=A0A915DXK5_9BILA